MQDLIRIISIYFDYFSNTLEVIFIRLFPTGIPRIMPCVYDLDVFIRINAGSTWIYSRRCYEPVYFIIVFLITIKIAVIYTTVAPSHI